MFIIGDIHGEYELFTKIYENICSIKESDEEVIVTGDIIDRGPSPVDCIKFAINNGIKSVMGNHEKMMLSSYNNPEDKRLWFLNGGYSTFSQLSTLDKSEFQEILEWVQGLPLYIYSKPLNTVIFHAGMIYNKNLSLEENLGEILFDDNFLWRRNSYLSNDNFGHLNTLFVSGHTPFNDILVMKNRIVVDTGAVFTGKISCVRIKKDSVSAFCFNHKDGFKNIFERER